MFCRQPAARRNSPSSASAIRKTGSYGTPSLDLSNPDQLIALLTTYAEDKKRLLVQVAEQAPKVEAFDRLDTSGGTLTITVAAKTLKVGPKWLFDLMSDHDWIYRRSGVWVGHQTKIDQGLLQHRVTTFTAGDESRSETQVRVTAKGLAKLALLIGSINDLESGKVGALPLV